MEETAKGLKREPACHLAAVMERLLTVSLPDELNEAKHPSGPVKGHCTGDCMAPITPL